MSLDELFNIYGSDKANIFKKIPWTWFLKYYEKIKKFKMKIKNIEIGSYAGASAAAFVKYFKEFKSFLFDINISNFKYKSKIYQFRSRY